MTRSATASMLACMKAVSLAAVSILCISCGPSAIDGGFDSANPAARMYAIEHAARSGDMRAVRRIVEQLDSDDPAVRFLAIGALERLTGETHGYCHADPPPQRETAILRWKQALGEGNFILLTEQADIPY